MRRSRIKAVATVPARRKPIKIEDAELKNQTTDVTSVVTDGATIKLESSERENSNVVFSAADEKLQQQQQELEEAPPLANSEKINVLEIVPGDVTATVKSLENSRKEDNKESSEVNKIPSENIAPLVGISDSNAKTTSNVENPSPTKTTRTSFMRPVPRLDGCGRTRRNSVQGSGASASESEDDSRRTGTNSSSVKRGGNDSAGSIPGPSIQGPKSCPVVGGGTATTGTTLGIATIGNSSSTSAAPPTNAVAPLPPSKSNTGSLGVRQKRKMVISESARKLAEARREFLLKHEHKQPDRTKLIMYDLIYYNPVTNPIKKTKNNAPGVGSSSLTTAEVERVPSNSAETEDEDEDDDPETSEAMPVPRVKVGPDGHLVIDEQSLVIEHTGAKRNRRAMARTEALVDEDGSGSGFYKRRKKSKDWPRWETLKFYKALNTVGTDFLLMQSLFPQRSRQEIKIKFKKEERSNRHLVEKALTYHQEFDIESLTKHLASFEEANKLEYEPPAKKNSSGKERNGRKTKHSKSRRVAELGISKETNSEASKELEETSQQNKTSETCEEQENISDIAARLKNVVGKVSGETKNGRKYKRIIVNDAIESESSIRKESTGNPEDSGSDTEIYRIKPTRSGRKPKVRKLQAPAINTLDGGTENEESAAESESNDRSVEEEREEEQQVRFESMESQPVDESLPEMSEVEPGSLVIVSRESPEDPGETMLQVYMVSSEIGDSGENSGKRNITPVILTPELLNTVATGITKVSPIDVKKE